MRVVNSLYCYSQLLLMSRSFIQWSSQNLDAYLMRPLLADPPGISHATLLSESAGGPRRRGFYRATKLETSPCCLNNYHTYCMMKNDYTHYCSTSLVAHLFSHAADQLPATLRELIQVLPEAELKQITEIISRRNTQRCDSSPSASLYPTASPHHSISAFFFLAPSLDVC